MTGYANYGDRHCTIVTVKGRTDFLHRYISLRRMALCTGSLTGRRLKIVFRIVTGLCFGSILIIAMNLDSKLLVADDKDRFLSTQVDVFEWYRDHTSFCGGNYTGYGNMFFKLQSAVYDPICDTFLIQCNELLFLKRPSTYFLVGGYAPKRYSKSLRLSLKSIDRKSINFNNRTTVVVYREYPHNFFHAMTQWYNIYVLSKLFKFQMKDVDILLLDRGPDTHIDTQWRLLFNAVTKAGELEKSVALQDAIFNIAGHESIMYYFNLETLPFIESFSKYYLSNFALQTKTTYDCKNLTITLVLRHDYYMHPGIKGEKRIAERKFKNEDEIITTLNQEFTGHSLRMLIAEDMSLPEQLELTSQTDILIGMHGCVLTHTLFMPHHGMVLEMYPSFWKIQGFFKAISKWRHINHTIWQNTEKKYEYKNHYIYVPPSVFKGFAVAARQHFVCK